MKVLYPLVMITIGIAMGCVPAEAYNSHRSVILKSGRFITVIITSLIDALRNAGTQVVVSIMWLGPWQARCGRFSRPVAVLLFHRCGAHESPDQGICHSMQAVALST